jgi:predicted deacylase
MLADGRELEVGGSSDAAARQIPGLVRLTQPGTQRCTYIRASAVVAVTAPSQGCVLHLSNGREVEAGEAAAVAAELLL